MSQDLTDPSSAAPAGSFPERGGPERHDLVRRDPARHDQVEAAVDALLDRLGGRLVVATPLGIGKPNQLLNGLYRRARGDRGLHLEIHTALTLGRPTASGALAGRLLGPLVERIFGDYPELEYGLDLVRGRLPPNVVVRQFYVSPGSILGSPRAQQSYVSSNYTHVVRDLLALEGGRGPNLIAQLVAPPSSGGQRYSLSSNPDLTLDLMDGLAERRGEADPWLLAGQVNPQLPWFGGDAALPAESFGLVLEDPDLTFDLFAPPNGSVGSADYLIGLYASALVQDGGTLQLGIGALSDAVCQMLLVRHRQPEAWDHLLAAAGGEAWGELLGRWGGRGPFETGLYAASEMLVDGFMALFEGGVLKRRVWEDLELEALVAAGRLDPERVGPHTLELLAEAGVVADPLTAFDLGRLEELGVLRPGLGWRQGPDGPEVVAAAGERCPATAVALAARPELFAEGRLAGGRVAHAGFFLGPRSFYQALRDLSEEERRSISMTRISFVNELYGQEALKRLQRRRARFINTGMVATLDGAVASDGLEDGRVVSGVGGQYNFVTMAQELEDGRSILLIQSVREKGGEVTSNLRWRYGHTTIPRHLRDIVVTEYGIADLRGKCDREVVEALIAVADSRFQEGLVAEARAAGKLPKDYRVPERFRANRPERLEAILEPARRLGLAPEFPFGTDLTDEEVTLGKALRRLEGMAEARRPRWPGLAGLGQVVHPPPAARPYLERMGLSEPKNLKERLHQAAVVYALEVDGAI